MAYFNELPDLFYQSPLSNKNSSLDYVRVKNLFRRVKVRDDLQNVFTAFNKYQIPDGVRPDNVAEELYGGADLDWVVLLTAGITNVRDQWPLSNKDLYVFLENKYGDDLNNTRFYEKSEDEFAAAETAMQNMKRKITSVIPKETLMVIKMVLALAWSGPCRRSHTGEAYINALDAGNNCGRVISLCVQEGLRVGLSQRWKLGDVRTSQRHVGLLGDRRNAAVVLSDTSAALA